MKNIHILPTHKPSSLWIDNNTNKLVYGLFSIDNIHNCKNQNIYITSDEEIKEGDYRFNTLHPNEGIFKVENQEELEYVLRRKQYKKIILTTDQDLIKDGVQAIDDEFLEWFVKNPTYEEVYIIKQYKQVNQDNPITKGSTALMFSHYEIHLLKATKQMIDEWNLIYCKLNNRKIPTKEEPKQETLEEAKQMMVTQEDILEQIALTEARGEKILKYLNRYKGDLIYNEIALAIEFGYQLKLEEDEK
jgi:hypothetical protein